ncbi:metallophosphoesterase [Roseivirga sp.]|uniref:metallophosphoesterase n=1 Tax=Roseivirga sp. TaxID=1964215 RepID=UPI003B52929F
MDYVIGDVHGEVSKLKELFDVISYLEDDDPRFIFIGDYVDKGQDPYATLSFLSEIDNREECLFIMGNHEYIWKQLPFEKRKYFDYLTKYGGQITAKSFGTFDLFEARTRMFQAFKGFFEKMIPFWECDEYVVTHSGIPMAYYDNDLPNVPINQLLFNRYEFLKNEKLFNGSKKVIFGHTAFYYPYVDNYKIGVDTGACYLESQPLTAYCIQTSSFFNSFGVRTELSELSSSPTANIVRGKPWRKE